MTFCFKFCFIYPFIRVMKKEFLLVSVFLFFLSACLSGEEEAKLQAEYKKVPRGLGKDFREIAAIKEPANIDALIAPVKGYDPKDCIYEGNTASLMRDINCENFMEKQKDEINPDEDFIPLTYDKNAQPTPKYEYDKQAFGVKWSSTEGYLTSVKFQDPEEFQDGYIENVGAIEHGPEGYIESVGGFGHGPEGYIESVGSFGHGPEGYIESVGSIGHGPEGYIEKFGG